MNVAYRSPPQKTHKFILSIGIMLVLETIAWSGINDTVPNSSLLNKNESRKSILKKPSAPSKKKSLTWTKSDELKEFYKEKPPTVDDEPPTHAEKVHYGINGPSWQSKLEYETAKYSNQDQVDSPRGPYPLRDRLKHIFTINKAEKIITHKELAPCAQAIILPEEVTSSIKNIVKTLTNIAEGP